MNNETRSGVTINIDLDPAHMPKAEDPTAALSGQEVWDMVQKVANDYSDEDLMDAFNEEYIGDVLVGGDLSWFCDKFKKYEADRDVIHVGDEVAWTNPYARYFSYPNYASARPCQHTGVVVNIQLWCSGSDVSVMGYHILTTDVVGAAGGYRTTYIPADKVDEYDFHKTGYKVRKMMEDNNGAKDS